MAFAFNIVDARALVDLIERSGAPTPPSLVKFTAVTDALNAASNLPTLPEGILDLSAEEVVGLVDARTKYVLDHYGRPLSQYGTEAVESAAAAEAAAALRNGEIDDVIEALRPAFDEAAAVLEKAAGIGITSTTTSDQILKSKNPEAIPTWRAVPQALAAIDAIAQFRIRVSELLGVSPTPHEQAALRGITADTADFSGVFTKDDTLSVDGAYHLNKRLYAGVFRAELDWLHLATNHLYLNTPAEYAAKFKRVTAKQYATNN